MALLFLEKHFILNRKSVSCRHWILNQLFIEQILHVINYGHNFGKYAELPVF